MKNRILNAFLLIAFVGLIAECKGPENPSGNICSFNLSNIVRQNDIAELSAGKLNVRVKEGISDQILICFSLTDIKVEYFMLVKILTRP